jgi:ATP adenylyltransferase
LDHLWSPWRLEYVIGPKTAKERRQGVPADAKERRQGVPADSAGCVFCDVSRLPHPASLVVYEGDLSYVILNLYPYNNGHLMVVPYRHEPTLAGLTSDEMNDVGRLTQLSERALREAYRLDGINIGVNLGREAGAGIVEHVHVHLVPRWNGDTNFMTTVGQTRVLPEKLAETAARLRPIFARLVV